MRQPEPLASATSWPGADSAVITGAGVTSPGITSPGSTSPSLTSTVPSVPGILTADQLIATGHAIATDQQADGSIGWPDGHVDAWNHVECAMALSVCGLRSEARRAYAWLAGAQQPDGSWPVQAASGGVVKEWTTESNHAAYCAVGVWHELLVTGDEDFAAQMWPVVRAAIEFAIGLQTPRGEIIWRRHEDGTPDSYALLTGSSSMYHSLRCAIALAERLGQPQPHWELAATLLGHVVACHGEAFADKSRFSMDWYYPVLGGPVRGAAAERLLKAGWDTFVVPGLGVRCVSDEPWVTGAETCELAIALAALGRHDQAMELFEQIQFLRAEDGSYWTGWQFVNGKHFPHEQSTWTAAAVVLAADVLAAASLVIDGPVIDSTVIDDPVIQSTASDSTMDARTLRNRAMANNPRKDGAAARGAPTGAAGIFRDAAAGTGVWQPSDPAACGCPPGG